MNNRLRSASCLIPDHPAGEVLIVVPTFEERENIAPLFEAFAALAIRPDVVIVDDGSTDGTAEAVRAAAASYPQRVFLVERTGKHGLGTAYCDGFQWVLANVPTASVIVQMDADLSHEPAAVPSLVAQAVACGACVGSRYVPGGQIPDWTFSRRLLSRAANVYAGTVLRLREPSYAVVDSTAGFVAWRRDVLQTLMQTVVPGQGYGFQISMKWLAHRAGIPIVEHPITFRDRRVGQSKLSKRIITEALVLPWTL